MKFTTILWAVSLFAATMALVYAQPTPEQKVSKSIAPDVGEKAVDFTLPYATKDTLVFEGMKLSDLFGKGPIILAFYPADWSGGCTKEMCTLRDNFSALQELNAQIVALSGDYVYTHHEWAKHHNLPFTLVSDYGGKVAKQYDSWNDEYGMCKRTVFLIDNQGKIAYRDLEYSVKDQKDFEDLKKALSDLKK
jgi:glutaredoxin-dependent peroxiredoxin